MNGPERRKQRQAEAEAQNFIRPKTPAEQLATEVDDILSKRFDRARTGPYSASVAAATADILDAVARYEAAGEHAGYANERGSAEPSAARMARIASARADADYRTDDERQS